MKYGLLNWVQSFDNYDHEFNLSWMDEPVRPKFHENVANDFSLRSGFNDSKFGEGAIWLDDFRDKSSSPDHIPESDDLEQGNEYWGKVFNDAKGSDMEIDWENGCFKEPVLVFHGTLEEYDEWAFPPEEFVQPVSKRPDGLMSPSHMMTVGDDRGAVVHEGLDWVIVLDEYVNGAIRRKAQLLYPEKYAEYMSRHP
tara:strand:+ start:514 stop:1101 length:588 start_codon:yes stop_codon:yes gene_type:complete